MVTLVVKEDSASAMSALKRTDQPLRSTSQVSVITQFDGLTFTNGDGQSGQDVQRPGQQNGTGIATGAVLASGG